MSKEDGVMYQQAPWPTDLELAVDELHLSAGLTGWRIWLGEADRGQRCSGLTLYIVPNNSDSYHPEQHAKTTFLYPVLAAAFNRESWEEWLWARIEETEGHERSEGFGFKEFRNGEQVIRRPFKPAHPDGWNPGVVRSVVSETVTNTPNAGRLVLFPCGICHHNHYGKMGEHFTIQYDRGCSEENCNCAMNRLEKTNDS